MWFPIQVTVLLVGYVQVSIAYKYRYILENHDLFTPCPDSPKGVRTFDGLFDMSEFTIQPLSDTIYISGNLTVNWNVKASDRFQTHITLYKYDRGDWFKTLYSMIIPNVCVVLFNEEQHWYKHWIKHVTNLKHVKANCIVPGTKLLHEPFNLDLTFDFYGPPMNGRHKIVVAIFAYDTNQVLRDSSVCYEILGEMSRM